MIDWILSLPLIPAVAFLYAVVLCRAGGTYALGRMARRAVDHGRLGAWLASARVERARRAVNTWGAPVVALSFLTIGFQTAANAAAGLTAMPLRRYLPALAIGGLAWAILYATVGLAAVMLWLELFLRSPWAAVAVLAVIAVVVLQIKRMRRRDRPTDQAPDRARRSPRRSVGRAARTR